VATVATEELGTAELADLARVSVGTILRWSTVGVLGADGTRVRLELRRVGGRYRGTRESLDAFFARLNEPAGIA
jgi:hypothetical protein